MTLHTLVQQLPVMPQVSEVSALEWPPRYVIVRTAPLNARVTSSSTPHGRRVLPIQVLHAANVQQRARVDSSLPSPVFLNRLFSGASVLMPRLRPLINLLYPTLGAARTTDGPCLKAPVARKAD